MPGNGPMRVHDFTGVALAIRDNNNNNNILVGSSTHLGGFQGGILNNFEGILTWALVIWFLKAGAVIKSWPQQATSPGNVLKRKKKERKIRL